MKDIAHELGISHSGASKSLNRSVITGLIDSDKKMVSELALSEFLKFGSQYVYFQRPSGLIHSVVTAHSAAPLVNVIQSNKLPNRA